MPFETCMTLSSLKWFTLGLVAPEMSIIDAVNPPNNAPNFMKDIYIRNSFERLVSQMYWFAFTFLFNNPNLSQYWIKMIKQKPTTLWYFWLLFPFLLFLLKWSQSPDQRSGLICLKGLLRLIGKLWSISSNQNLSTWLPERIVGMPSLMIITLAQAGISKHSHTNPEAVRAHYSCFMNTVYAKPDKFSANTRETESHLSFPLIKVNGVIFCFFCKLWFLKCNCPYHEQLTRPASASRDLRYSSAVRHSIRQRLAWPPGSASVIEVVINAQLFTSCL